MPPPHPMRNSLLILSLALALGTGGYMFIEGWSFFDALYMVVITLSTVGYRELGPLSTAGQLFTICLILTGVGALAYAVGRLVQFMVEGQVQRIFGRRKVEKKITRLEGHYIVCGYGRIGALISQELAFRPVPFVVVEKDPLICDELAAAGSLFVQGDATDDQTLIAAGILRAKGLITAVTSESENVYITLTARGLNPDLFILARSGEESSEIKLRRAGATKVISPYRIGASRMAWAILRPSVVDFIDIAIGGESLELQLEEIRIAPDSILIGKTLIAAGIRREWGVMIIAIKKHSGQMLFNPPSDTAFAAEDILITLGEQPATQRLERVAAGGTVHV